MKKSNLRRSIAYGTNETKDEDSSDKPTINRTASFKKKKKPASSRLSFGVGDIISGSDAENLEEEESFNPIKKPLSRKVTESNAKKNAAVRLPLPMREREDEDGGKPTYSKDYLNELKGLTPNAPRELEADVTVEEEGLDASELEGAMVVDMDVDEKFGGTEIREKKERRARMAREKDFISLNDDSPGDGGRQISLLPRAKKAESRLVREDEDIAEGFDDFVEDGRISLGKKQERESRRRRKKEMADLIQAAEGSSGEDTDDSEAERRAAYEAAQTRAGMDGLHKYDEAAAEKEAVQVPARIAPIPVLDECLERLQNTLGAMEMELKKRKRKIEDGEREKREISKREAEVQVLLTQTGARYAALKVGAGGDGTVEMSDAKAVVDAHAQGFGGEKMGGNRGLESFGNTPTVRGEVVDGS
ncbi:nineteen complex-related 2 domain-containing protein [Rutstroemia sp. NJR-2017a BBW]|nr:nineteen complex-related 2 domain-containing protein [Rutstroemia sp. NJR-2017a BBW]